jgi:methylase of polypeptide subunit release factors
LDINPAVVHTARTNVKLHQFSGRIDVRKSDLFATIALGDTFSVITMNPPFTLHPVSEPVEASTWASDFALHQRFSRDVHQFLTLGGRIYLGQADFGSLDRVQVFATQAGFDIRLLGRKHLETEPPCTYYAFQLTLGH